jgi:tRNA-2-methylthio-N6-dimethylallyladenosine synthase
MVPADGIDDADVVVLNTCCIRENADNKLYGTLGHLKSVKDAPARWRSWSAAASPRRTATSSGEGAVRRRRVRHPQRAPRRRPAHAQLGERVRSPRSSRQPSSTTTSCSRVALPARREVGYTAWVTIQIGCDNSARSASCRRCAARDQPAVRRSSTRSAAAGADGVTEVTLLGQNVNSYGRDLTLRRARQAGRRGRLRRCGPCSPTCCGRSVRSRASAGSLHEPAPEGPAARDDRRHGRDPRGVRAPPPARCSRAATGCWPRCTGATPPSATSKVAAARAGDRRPRGDHRHHRRLPRRDRRRLRATLEVAAAAEYDSAYTFVYSPRPGTEAAELTDRFVDRP